ncbi:MULTISPECIES: endolytic transglycosylase MltG [Streptomyces]|uniref:Endolytic murein transglycosylase n=1 Tax=Streptomyces bobili TaxID=67280 RepID=A0ABZ1R6S7_9ACTN|nr:MULTISPECIES: endolytic transglycosylase MltG [Streptomyces]QEU64835.1 endolytic transglycosylase MltG [Streptomyces galilaeus]GGW66412.1 membrane protein [Streptomyces galilaeus]
MTEYGRGPGSEPWHPEDPLYGDVGWEGQQGHTGHQPAYGGQPQHQYPQQPQQQEYGDWNNGGPQPYDQQQYDQQQYEPSYDQQQYAGQGQQYGQPNQQAYNEGGWDGTGTHAHIPYAADPGDPYGQQAAAYGAEQPDFYGTPDAYPPPEPPARRRAEPEAEQPDWDPGPDQGEHAFFAGGGADDEDDDEPEGRGDRRGRGGKGAKKEKKSRNGCACLVVLLVFGGGLGGITYFGYQFYQNRYGAAPDYAGAGNSQTVSIEIPKGAGGVEIGRRLKDAGVVKSVDAFVSAFTSSDGDKIQAGAYILKKEMSAENAVEMMLDPKSQANVVVTPGQRNISVYKAIDTKLGLTAGTTRGVAEKDFKTLGLPDWANADGDIKDPLEGFLFPGTYPAAKGMKPASVLKEMVGAADAAYGKFDLDAKAKALKLEDPLQVITVASMVQAEGKTHDDFRKMAEVIYNRLKPTNTQTNQLLQFDSTFNYLKNESNIHISESEINKNQDPYNTYTQKGLPPGPIGSPGSEALAAALNPTSEGWLYFVATDGENNTEFAKTYAEFEKLKDKFNESAGN